jgi:hypothetical protein
MRKSMFLWSAALLIFVVKVIGSEHSHFFFPVFFNPDSPAQYLIISKCVGQIKQNNLFV